LVAAKDSRQLYVNGFAREKVTSKAGKSKPNSRVIRDGVGASDRSGRWISAMEMIWGIGKVLVYWCAVIICNVLAKAGIRDRPRWLLSIIRKPNSGNKIDANRNEKIPNTLDFWMLGEDGELLLPKDENVDVEVEMRKRFKGDKDWDRSDELELESNLYGWWLAGGWWGENDSSGTFKPETQVSHGAISYDDLRATV
jgi:hypothetical protein